MDGETALLVPPDNAPALADALQRLQADGALRTHLSAGARRLYDERASEAVLGARWRALLERVT